MNIPEVLSDKEADEVLEKGLYFDHKPSDGEVHRTIQRDHDLRWFVEWLEEKGILVVAETDRVLLKLVEHSQPNALLLNITDIQDLKDMAELEKE